MKVSIKGRLNQIPRLNDFLDEWNHELQIGDQLDCVAITSHQEFAAIIRKYPIGIGRILVILNYIWHEMMPRLKTTRRIYFFFSGERHRTFSRTEILGRISRAGFKIEKEIKDNGVLHVIAKKRSEPLERNDTCESPILKMKRTGKDGKLIEVYKFRTMHSYSQYIQDYVYEQSKLDHSGKLTDDFRVNIWGRLFRSAWLDELPMIFNVLKGDMKWVGVRPLTPHFFSLYTPEMQELRSKVKPGLLPPLYYEKKTPIGLDEIQESERRYIEAYLKHPFRTDWRYFWGTVYNILLRSKRSQ
ncbi:MAG: sugar transferase [Bacteroidaceae bacterium]|nr:sugar transferase [Bacteroidaceae bacterium]